MKYYYADSNNNTVGPIDTAQLQNLYRNQTIALDTLIIAEGESDWRPYKATFPPTSPLPQYNPIPSSPVRATAAHLPVQSSTEPLAIWSLVLGIISIIGCSLVTGIPAVICGHMGRSKIKNNSALRGAGMALAGLITGYISMVIPFVAIVAAIAIPNIAGITQQAEVSSARRNAQLLASTASAVRAAGYTNTWTTKEEAIKELRSGITVESVGTKYGPFILDYLTDEKVEAASKYLQLDGDNLSYLP